MDTSDARRLAAADQELAQVDDWIEQYIHLAQQTLGDGASDMKAMAVIHIGLVMAIEDEGIAVSGPLDNMLMVFARLVAREAKRTMMT